MTTGLFEVILAGRVDCTSSLTWLYVDLVLGEILILQRKGVKMLC